jgi:hypothetical protein
VQPAFCTTRSTIDDPLFTITASECAKIHNFFSHPSPPSHIYGLAPNFCHTHECEFKVGFRGQHFSCLMDRTSGLETGLMTGSVKGNYTTDGSCRTASTGVCGFNISFTQIKKRQICSIRQANVSIQQSKYSQLSNFSLQEINIFPG